MKVRLATAEISFHIDVNVGDPIYPEPQVVSLPLLLGGELQLHGYPVVMVHAEKLITALARGTANTRWRDFADMLVLSSWQSVGAHEMREALLRVSRHRRVELIPISVALVNFASISQSSWAIWVRKQRLGATLPESLELALNEIFDFADPVLTGEVVRRMWVPASRSWR